MSSIIDGYYLSFLDIFEYECPKYGVHVGIIHLTLAAKFALHSRPLQAVDELSQLKQVDHPEVAASCRDRHKHIRVGRVGPCPRQGLGIPVVTEEEHPILPPRLLDSHERELTPKPRMKRVSHPNRSILTIWFGCS